TMEEAHRAGDEQDVASTNHPIEVHLARPCALDHARLVPEHGFEDAQAGACRYHALARDLADQRHVLADLRPGDRRHRARVLVPAGDVEEQVPARPDPEPGQRLGAPRAHALQVLDGFVERRIRTGGRHGSGDYEVSTSRAKLRGSNGSRSSTPSPVPTSLTGMSNSSRSATTTPPRAVLSSFASTRPLSFNALPKNRTWESAFCPTVASSTRSVSCGAPGSLRASTR